MDDLKGAEMPEAAKGWGTDIIAYLPMTKAAVRGLGSGLEINIYFLQIFTPIFLHEIFYTNFQGWAPGSPVQPEPEIRKIRAVLPG